ncbi:sugar ABC transporter substrate-binding protein [Demequina aurantiaca]|uniref:sugar ABC transporter substrate-binding protein n=1 Tax=Demequina aurantiaca TaxID=676200 RepID=UPI00078589C4|nr:extracellular solute-binding protein [Demequina aurantiaca]
MLKTKKSLGLGAVLVTAGLLITACSSSTDDTATSTSPEPSSSAMESTSPAAGGADLVVWVDSERADALAQPAADYEAKTGVHVEIVGRDNATLKDDFIQQANSGSGPDITMGAHDWLGELTANGVVAPLELGDKADDYLPVALDASTYEGTVYELPYAVENLAVLRNADLVPEAAGDYDDMIAKGEAAGAEYPFVVEQGAEGNPYHLYPFQTSFDAPVFGRDDAGSYDPTQLKLGDGDQFAEWLGEQGKEGNMSTEITGDIAKEKFTSGDAAFWLTGPWNLTAATEAGINVAVDAVPAPGPSAAAPFAGVKGFFVNEYSENKVAANDFLVNYIGTEDVQLALYESGKILPALKAAADTAAADPLVSGFLAAGTDAVPMPAIPAMGQVWQYWGIAEAAILDGADPDSTWTKLTSDVEAAIAG